MFKLLWLIDQAMLQHAVLMVAHWFYYQFDMYIVSQFSFCKIELFPLPNLLIKKKQTNCLHAALNFLKIGIRN